MVKKKSSTAKKAPAKKKTTAKKQTQKPKAKAASKPASAKRVADVVELPREEASVAAAPAPTPAPTPAPEPAPSLAKETTLEVKLTGALLSKLRRNAEEEGVDLATLVQELLAEGTTLRAFEIVERKSAMRAPQGQQQHAPKGNFNHNGNRGGGNRRHRRGGSGGNGNNGNAGGNSSNGQGNWMEDKAAFLEYVRNQEKRRR